MEKKTIALGLISTMGGEHLVINRLVNNSYTLPGGTVAENELPQDGMSRIVFEETGLKFKPEDFEVINIRQKEIDGILHEIFAFGCKQLISEESPIFSSDKHIKPLFMEASMFYTLTNNKEFYLNLFPRGDNEVA